MPDATATIGTCLSCDYDLRGLHSRNCPECGRAFDPADPSTLASAEEMRLGRLGRWAMARPQWPAWTGTAVAALIILWYARSPLDVRSTSAIYKSAWPVLIVFWGGRLTLHLFLRFWRRRSELRRFRGLSQTLTVCLIAALLAVLMRTEVLSAAALKFSTPALNRLLSEVPVGYPEEFLGMRRAGLYLVKGGQRHIGFRLYSSELDATLTPDPDRNAPTGEWECRLGQWFYSYEPM